MVTAELAVGLMVTVLICLVALWGVGVGAQQLALGDVAVQAVRQEARGDRDAVREIERRAEGVRLEVRRRDGLAEVVARARTRRFGALPSLELTAGATAQLEPGEKE